MSTHRNFALFTRSIVAISAFALAPIFCLSPSAIAQSQLLDFKGGSTGSSGGNNTLGWEFSLSQSLTVTDLGVFNAGNNGLTNPHQVGLWTIGGSLLAQTTLASGLSGSTTIVSGSGFGSFRYNSITGVTLSPGSYVLGAAYVSGDADAIRTGVTSTSMASGSSFTQLRFIQGTGFAFPNTPVNFLGHFGPNLRFTAAVSAATPEPGSVTLLMGLGVTGIGFALSRRRRK